MLASRPCSDEITAPEAATLTCEMFKIGNGEIQRKRIKGSEQADAKETQIRTNML